MDEVELEKAGDNPDQAPRAYITAPLGEATHTLKVGDRFHIKGQPDDVLWRVTRIITRR